MSIELYIKKEAKIFNALFFRHSLLLLFQYSIQKFFYSEISILSDFLLNLLNEFCKKLPGKHFLTIHKEFLKKI